MSYENVKSSRARLKERVVRALGGKCVICGYNRCQQALDVHHVDPNEKDFTIAANTNKAYALVSEEIRKCVLLCANCHREYHSNFIQLELQPSFDEKVDAEIKQELEVIKNGDAERYRCRCCGKAIGGDGRTGLCPECYMKTTRRADRPEREILKQLIREVPMTRIAADYGVTDNAIRKWCDAYNLPRTKSEIKKYSDEEWATL
jgi:hypothetical protein